MENDQSTTQQSQATTSASGSTVIAKHIDKSKIKGQTAACITIIILGVILAAFGIIVAATLDDAMSVLAILLGFGIFFIALGAIMLFVFKKQTQVCGKTAIVHNQDGTITLNASSSKPQTISPSDIKAVKFVPMVKAQYLGIVTRYIRQEYGSIKIATNSGKKYFVKYVDQGETVADLIKSYK